MARWDGFVYSEWSFVKRAVKTTARSEGGDNWKRQQNEGQQMKFEGFPPMHFCCLQLANESLASYIR